VAVEAVATVAAEVTLVEEVAMVEVPRKQGSP
jgi:hypothetical protein